MQDVCQRAAKKERNYFKCFGRGAEGRGKLCPQNVVTALERQARIGNEVTRDARQLRLAEANTHASERRYLLLVLGRGTAEAANEPLPNFGQAGAKQ